MLPDTCTSSKVVSREKGDANCFTRKAFDSTNSEGRRTIVQPTSTNIEGRIVMVVNLLSYCRGMCQCPRTCTETTSYKFKFSSHDAKI